MNDIKEWEKLLKNKDVRDMISHLHEFSYVMNGHIRMTI